MERSRTRSWTCKVRLKGRNLIWECWRFGLLFATCFVADAVRGNLPPRFLIDGQTEIVLRLKEGAATPVGKLQTHVHRKSLYPYAWLLPREFFVCFHRSAQFRLYFLQDKGKGKGKAVPLQAWSGPEGSRKLRFPDFMTAAQDGGKVVSLTHRPPLSPGNTPGTHFC